MVSSYAKKYLLKVLLSLFLLIVVILTPEIIFGASAVTLQWNQNQEPEVIGYKIYFGNAPRTYEQSIDVGDVTLYEVTGLDSSKTYYFAATAYSAEQESDFSKELEVVFDTTAPTGSISINNGQSVTTSQTVTLSIQANDAGSGMGSGAEMKFSNDNTTWSAPVSFSQSRIWNLSSGFGTKTVYARFKDAAGNWMTTSVSDTIVYEQTDTNAPTGSISINNGQSTTTSQTVTLSIQANDAGSGMGSGAEMKFSNDNTTWSAPVSFSQSRTWTLSSGFGTKTVYARFKDAAGNWMTTSVSDSIVYEQLTNDRDGDGMPDDWEIANGLNPNDAGDAALDNDNDGKTNLAEYQAGTDPNDPADNRPVANAGPDQVTDPTLVILDGSQSSDPNGDPLSYAWTQIQGRKVTLIDSDKESASFTGVKSGNYVFELVVNDGSIDSPSDTVNVTIKNVKPTANPGKDQTATIYSEVILDGSGSTDANMDELSYQWAQVAGSPVEILNAGQALASFTPVTTGVHKFALTVTDGMLSDTQNVSITVNDPSGNKVPVADAGEDQTVTLGSVVTLDGSGSLDADGDALLYDWEIVSGPADDYLQDPAAVSTTFTPSAVGIYIVALTVFDGTDHSLEDYVIITVNSSPTDEGPGEYNTVPVANAGEHQQALAGDLVVLDGSNSYDDDGDSLTYHWTQTSGTTVTLSDASSARPEFYAIYAGTCTFALVVHDGKVASLPDTVTVVIEARNSRPVADAGNDRSVATGTKVVLDGSDSYDLDGDYLMYHWEQIVGPAVSLENAVTATPYFIAPIDGQYIFELIVSDGDLESEPDIVMITAGEGFDIFEEIQLLYPENEAVLQTLPTLKWDAESYDVYKVQISKNGKRFYTIGFTQEAYLVMPDSFTFITNANKPTPIYWRVLGKNDEDINWQSSEVWVFSVLNSGGQEDERKKEVKEELEKFIKLLWDILRPRSSDIQ